MSITRGTTPTLRIGLPDSIELEKISSLYVTLKQNDIILTKSKNEISIEEGKINLYLTQEETLNFDKHYEILLQVRGLCNGNAFASKISSLSVEDILLEGVIE